MTSQARKPRTDLSKVPTNALLKEIERRSSKEYLRRVAERSDFCGGKEMATEEGSGQALRIEPDPKKWCGKLLAYSRGNEIECNLTQGHSGQHRHIYEYKLEEK